MQILKNKHLILAMFVAPLLAIIAYFGVDSFVSETPHVAQQGESYKLAAKSNCRYQSGACTLKNGDIEVKLSARVINGNQVEVVLESEMPVQNALISIAGEGEEPVPSIMSSRTELNDILSAKFYQFDTEKSILRLALTIADTVYYAETATIFIDYETSFSRDNFTN